MANSNTSTVSICNVALASLGANLINSLDEQTNEATLCNATWDNARRSTLRAHPWNFSIKRLELAPDTNAPVWGFKYSFTLPADLLRLIQVKDGIEYKVEGRKILSDNNVCFIKYVYDNEDVTSWDDMFKDLMAVRMKMELAYGVTKSSSQFDASVQLYAHKLRETKFIDSSEDIEDEIGQFDHNLIGVRQ